MTADVHLDAVTVRYESFTAVDSASLRIAPGEFFSFLGPSGCGKTTILRAISGFVDPTEGAIRIGGADMAGIGPNKRPTALIFQNLALFPMMSVADNIGYGLRIRGVPKRTRDEKVDALLNLVALGDQGAKRVDELSGGQRQRVAIARALAVEPQVLLLDEPLSALDLKLRQHMRNELRAIQRRVGITFIYITHDQGEALTMSDRIAVMNRGRILQIGEGRAVYDNPTSAFVASFVGETNPLHGRVTRTADGLAEVQTDLGLFRGRNTTNLAQGAQATLFIRPEAIRITTTADNLLPATADEHAYEGAATHLAVHAGATRLNLLLPAAEKHIPEEGAPLTIGFTAEDALVLPREA